MPQGPHPSTSQVRAQVPSRLRIRSGLLAGFCLLMVASNLRTVISAVSPVLPEIQADLGLSAGAAGFALTLTVLCFGLGALICPILLRIMKPTTLMTLGMIILSGGAFARIVLPGVAAFFVSTFAVGIGVAIGNVVVPILVRLRFAHRVGLVTGAYAVTLSSGSVFAAGLTWPFIHLTDGTWHTGQLPWAIWAVICLVMWVLAVVAGVISSRRAGTAGEPGLGRLLRTPLAWAVTAVMGLQSLVFYSILSWGPTVMLSAGIDATTAGFLLSLMSITAIAGNLLSPIVVAGRRTVPGLIVIGACYLVGLALLPWGLLPATIGVSILGVGIGSSLPYALARIATSFPVGLTGSMSAMAQGFGYLLAGLGPWLFGSLHEVTHSWLPSLGFAALAGLSFSVIGIGIHRVTRRS